MYNLYHKLLIMAKNVLSDINKILKQNNCKVAVSEKNWNTNFRLLGIDSLVAMSLIADLETIYKVRIEDQQLLKITTAKQLIDTINKLAK